MKIPFEVPVEWASAGIESCAKIVIKGKVKEGVVVKEKINGNWKDNNYFNCGCNRLAYTPTYNEVGAVSQKHMDGLVKWFETHKDYSLLKAKVLRNDTKYNFTLVVEQRCLNFHMVVCK